MLHVPPVAAGTRAVPVVVLANFDRDMDSGTPGGAAQIGYEEPLDMTFCGLDSPSADPVVITGNFTETFERIESVLLYLSPELCAIRSH